LREVRPTKNTRDKLVEDILDAQKPFEKMTVTEKTVSAAYKIWEAISSFISGITGK